jgi:hypothetical protein
MDVATIGVLTNLATATAADRGVVATLTEANARLAKQLEDNYNGLRALKATIKQERRETRGQRSFNPSPNNYCWKHGYKVANTHTSLSCNFPKQVHIRETTRADNMGGSQANKEWCARAENLNKKTLFEYCRTPPLSNPHKTAMLDSGCTGNSLLVNTPCVNKVKSQNPLTVRLPSGATTESTHTSSLDIPELNKDSSIVQIFPGITNHYSDNLAMKANPSHSGLTRSQFTTHKMLKFWKALVTWTLDFGASTCTNNINNTRMK